MTGSHEVRGSIPLGSTNNAKNLQRASRLRERSASSAFICGYTVLT